MADFVYNEAKRALLAGELDFTTDDIRVIFLMSNTTAGTDKDANTVANIGTLDQCDGVDHPATGMVLGTLAVNEDVVNNRAEFDAADLATPPIEIGTRENVALLLLKFQTTIAGSLPLAYLDSGGFPMNLANRVITLVPGADGILWAD